MGNWRITGFEEIEEIGRGAQGRVVLARHTETGTLVAIKYVDSAAGTDIVRLRHEAQLLGQVSDPHVAQPYRLVENQNGAAIVLEFVHGSTLKQLLAEGGALAPEQALTILKGSLLGLAAAHAAGVVHRDYKPANVMVRPDGLSKLIDFGIAIPAGEGDRSGTPAYMAPEQWRGGAAVPATDVYAVTCVFFECLTGRRPFGGGDRTVLETRHLNTPPPLADVPESVRGLVARGMAKTADGRPPGAAVFVRELEEAAEAAYGPDWEHRGVRALAGAVAALSTLLPVAAAALPVIGGGAGGAAAGGSAAGGGAAAGLGSASGASAASASAAGGGAAGTAAGAAGAGTAGGGGAVGGFLASIGGKVTVGALGAVIAGGGTAAVSIAQDRDTSPPERARPVAAAVATQNQRIDGLPMVVRSQYVRITGHRDPAVQEEINKALRYPLDWTIQRVRAATADPFSPCVKDSVVKMTAQVGIKGPSVISANYPVNTSSLCYFEHSSSPTWAVTVDLETGRTLTVDDVLKPSTLTADGLTTLVGRLDHAKGSPMWGPDGCAVNYPERSDFFQRENSAGGSPARLPPIGSIFFASDGFNLIWSPGGDACPFAQLAAPYAEIRDLLEPDFAAGLPD